MTFGTMFQQTVFVAGDNLIMKAVNLATHFSKKVFYLQPKLEFLIGVVHTKNHTYKFFSKRVNQSNLLTTQKTTPRWHGIA